MSTCELTRSAAAQPPRAGQIADAKVQDRVALTGMIRTTQTLSVGTSPVYRCVLADDSGDLDLLFLGHASVTGLVEGTRCSIEGTVTARRGRLAVWNPRYQVEPAPATRPPETGATGSGAAGPADAAAVTEAAQATGHFRIYLAAAAGAGKTIAMIDEGNRRHQRGADVVIAFVEDHGRPVTQARAARLETVPRRVAEYHGARFEEMDTDAVLRRHPGVALVDELAHTNVPGSGRHAKRWQDVLELLDAGIDVISTVNIQHVESMADAVEQITSVPVRERVPDWVVRRADQIELVDSSPEQLRIRLLHGNIYPADQVSQALTHFFRADNLAALRELALRFLADETDDQLGEHLARHLARVRGETVERVVVGVTPAPGAETVVRHAARLAARIEANLDVVHVASQYAGRRDRDDGLAPLRRLVSDVGATWHELSADDLVSALVEYARNEQVSLIVVGSSQRSRWRELIGGGSIVVRASRLAPRAGIDVHIVALREDSDRLG
jgi:two-component system, OmpR family, sensor histidine kinase KdpD